MGYVQTIPKSGKMRVEGKVVADQIAWENHGDPRTIEQVRNTAHLPGVVGPVWAMADWHHGYGFPIGGVVATDLTEGVVSPGGVGFDINCGVRMLATDLVASDALAMCKDLGKQLAKAIPAGAVRGGGVDLTPRDLTNILENGAEAAIEHGWGMPADLNRLESGGRLENAGPVSERSRERGIMQLGTLGSGNHFLELQSVESIHDHEAARAFGIAEGSLVAMIHSGSRGLGHQVCSESVQEIEADHIPHEGGVKHRHHGHVLPDRQLAAAPINSIEGQAYLGAMRSAANFAFANRSVLSHRLRDVLTRNFGMDGEARVVYDVAHNIAKEEVHSVHGSNCVCCVHRKGATRAFPGDSLELAEDFRGIGQPVLVPGDMGRASWILAGPKEGANQAYSSSCHGAGRQLSRTAARKSIDVAELKLQLQNDGVEVRAKTARLLSEEAPNAYKDVDEVIRMTVGAELARPVARMRPLIVVKG